MQLSPHFTLAEFTRSSTATRHGIDNDLPLDLYQAARQTAAMLERVREELSRQAGREIPVQITSGFRCLPLNRLLKSDDGSDHPKAEAGDILAPRFGSPTDVARALAPHVDRLNIGQLINEFPDRDGWVHVSRRRPAKAINRIITITGRGTFPGILSA